MKISTEYFFLDSKRSNMKPYFRQCIRYFLFPYFILPLFAPSDTQ